LLTSFEFVTVFVFTYRAVALLVQCAFSVDTGRSLPVVKFLAAISQMLELADLLPFLKLCVGIIVDSFMLFSSTAFLYISRLNQRVP